MSSNNYRDDGRRGYDDRQDYNNRGYDNRQDYYNRGYDDRRDNDNRRNDNDNNSQYGGSNGGRSGYDGSNSGRNDGDRGNYQSGYNGNRGGYQDQQQGRGGYANQGGCGGYVNRGSRGGFGNQGGRGGFGNYRGGRGGNDGNALSDRMGRMNVGGTRGNNMYSQTRPAVSRVPRTGTMGELAGSAQHPNMPVAKKDLAHNSQKFCERPDGSVFDKKAVGIKTELFTNHALVHLPENTVKLFSYNIEIFNNRKPVTKREQASPLFYEIVNNNRREFPNPENFIFNDVNQLWTSVQLPFADRQVGNGRSYMRIKYVDTVDFGRTIREDQNRQLLATLIDAIATQRARSPHNNKFTVFKRCMFMIQDVTERPDEVMDAPLTVPLGVGLDARCGISIGIKLNLRAGITACYDVAHTMFTRSGYPLIRLLCEMINYGPITDEDFEDIWDAKLREAVFTEGNRRELDRILRKMKLRYSNETGIMIAADGRETVPSLLRYTQKGKEFKYYDLTSGTARDTRFYDNEGREWTIAQYFLECSHIRLRYPNLPCLIKKPTRMNNRFIAYPMEFVSYIVEPKRFEGSAPERVKNDLIEYTAYAAAQRLVLFQKVMGQEFIADVPPPVDNNDDHMKRHGLTIEKQMLSAKATVLPPPTVVYGEGSVFKDVDHMGEWEAVTHDPIRKVLEGSANVRTLDKEAPVMKKRLLGSILHVYSPGTKKTEMHYDSACYHRLMKAVEDCGQPVAWENREYGQAAIQGNHHFYQSDERYVIYEFFGKLKNTIDAKYKEADDEVLIPFVLVVFETRCSTLVASGWDFANNYNYIKYLGDNEIGIFTQGILLENLCVIQEHPRACKLTRLMVEKILGKVGTTHRKLDRNGGHKSWTKLTDPNSPTLILGVDVSHPSPRDRLEHDVRKLSIATVVGNIDIDCTEYRASSRIQDAGEENIVHFREEFTKRINEFRNYNRVLPAHIVIYRDGICDGDFQRILYEERLNIEGCCKDLGPSYTPTITYIVVSKRHHTRFFLKNESEGHEQQGFNILPGTLVEDTVTTTDHYDFFLSTQVGQKGVARPTHYYVLHDTWKPFVSFWPTVTHALTYLFCRTTSTVSLPAPVIYAHLAAKRAKECLDGAWNVARYRNERLSADNYADVDKLTKAININNGLDGMTFV